MTSGVWGTCLVSGTPSTAWSSVQQKFSVNVVEWDMKLRGRGVVRGLLDQLYGVLAGCGP